jgi:hypothetical protein
MARPSAPQLAYINDLYGKLDVSFSKREKPNDVIAARSLITHLKEMVDERVNKSQEDE